MQVAPSCKKLKQLLSGFSVFCKIFAGSESRAGKVKVLRSYEKSSQAVGERESRVMRVTQFYGPA